MLLLNAPWLFTSGWAIVSPWLEQRVRDKAGGTLHAKSTQPPQFFVLGANYQSVLLEHVDADALPEEYGGTCHCHPHCLPPIAPDSLGPPPPKPL